MPYSEAELEAMQYDPLALARYFWRVAMGCRRRALVSQREIIQRGQYSAVPRFDAVFDEDWRNRRWADTELSFSKVLLENLDMMVRGCLERPKACAKCRSTKRTK